MEDQCVISREITVAAGVFAPGHLGELTQIEHPDTLIVRAYLAHWTGKAGDAAAARDLFAALLPVRERVSGPEHPNTVTVRADLAAWTRQASQLT